jgi:hypothetical protein
MLREAELAPHALVVLVEREEGDRIVVQYGWMRVRASDWTMKELRNVQNVSEAMWTPHDGMIGLGDRTSAGPSSFRESDVWISNEIRWRNSQPSI